MGIRPRRVITLALAFLLAACSAQIAAPRPSEAPEARHSPTPRPTNASGDLLYVRSIGGYGQGSLLVVDARTGTTVRTMADGAVSADRTRLFWTEPANGATQTVVHVTDLVSGIELRNFTVESNLKPFPFTGSLYELSGERLTGDAAHLVLTNSPFKTLTDWITKVAVVDTRSGTVIGSTEIASPLNHHVLALSPDGRSVFLDQYGGADLRVRVYDVASGGLSDVSGPTYSRNGFRTPGVVSADGRWLFRVDTGNASPPDSRPPAVFALDLVARRASMVPLPIHRSTSFDAHLLWSIVLTPDGSALYAVNPALGVIHDIDPRGMTLRRTGTIAAERGSELLAALGQFLLPVADAKRAVLGGAAVSPDGRTLYAAGHQGIAVVETATLALRQVWETSYQFDLIALSADGLRLYAVDNLSKRLAILDTRDGVSLGHVELTSSVPAIVRIDSAP